MKPTLISLDDPQSRVLSCKVFSEKYYPTAGRCGDFSENPKGLTLQDKLDTGFPLSNEIGVGSLFMTYFCVYLFVNLVE